MLTSFLKTVGIVVISLLATLAFSQPALAQGKIAVIDFEEAILRSDYAKKRLEELNLSENFKQLMAEYNSLKADFQALQKDYEANAEKWTDDKRQSFQEKASYIRADLELASKKLNAKREQILQDIAQAMQGKARTALGELIESEKISLLLDRKAVLSANQEYNLTDKLVAKLNQG